MKIKSMNKFIKFFFGNIIGISLYPFGIYTNDKSPIIINHEKIHWKQQIEMLIFPFYIWYFIELLIRRINKNNYESYMSLLFERESYNNENDLDYLKTRKHFAWIKYLKNKN